MFDLGDVHDVSIERSVGVQYGDGQTNLFSLNSACAAALIAPSLFVLRRRFVGFMIDPEMVGSEMMLSERTVASGMTKMWEFVDLLLMAVSRSVKINASSAE
jgi:hypothetical protein